MRETLFIAKEALEEPRHKQTTPTQPQAEFIDVSICFENFQFSLTR